jgi:hypothetical protein
MTKLHATISTLINGIAGITVPETIRPIDPSIVSEWLKIGIQIVVGIITIVNMVKINRRHKNSK